MTRNRLLLLIGLAILPVAFLTGVGLYHLFTTHWLFWAWWPMSACFAVSFVLAWRWQKRMHRQVGDEPPPLHWTDRDRLAWQKIEERIKETKKVDVDELAGIQLYVDLAQKMAPELAAIYHPGASDPMANLTIPEILAVVELAAHDLGEMAKTYLPGGHLVTINHLRQARKAAKWYSWGSNAMWAVSAIFDPVRTGLRYTAAQAGLGKPFGMFKDNAFLWLYANYVRRLGHYLVELYSGRLKVGAQRYRELLDNQEPSTPLGQNGTIVVNGEAPAKARALTIAVIGQVKAGKSSLINALLGERRAFTDVTPATNGVSRYELRGPVDGSTLIFLDTVGYNQAGPAADQFEQTVAAAREADLIFLVCHARNPGREADVALWRDLTRWFADHPELKMPPAALVVTHIDLLTPALEWSPPYDWRRPDRAKEKNIAEAVAVAREQFGGGIATFVPVCSAENKVFGVQEELIPTLAGLLGEARAVAFLRCLHDEADEKKLQKIFAQVLAAGKMLLGSFRA
jgi:uncharacterized protein